MTLSRKQLEVVCLINAKDGRCCRYLGHDDQDKSKYVCGKLNKSHKATIDAEVADELKEMQRKGVDPKKSGNPLGDNCPGYPLLSNIEQGFDIKPKT